MTKLPDFTRWAWASLPERLWWQPLFAEASAAFTQLERLSVVERLRPACWQPVTPEQLPTVSRWAHAHDLLCLPVEQVAHGRGYSNCATPVQPGEPFAYRCLFVHAKDCPKTWPLDDATYGRLLGYPTCCQEAFAHTWGRGQVDSTWEQHRPTTTIAHTLLRGMGLRLVPHLPCSFDCGESLAMATEFHALGLRHGFEDEMRLLIEVLRWPVAWSRLFGIAEIVTPALKISTRTDWTPTKDAFAVTGAYQRPVETLWTDNGFTSPTAMRHAHRVLTRYLTGTLLSTARVLDLGCGNGALIRRLARENPGIKIAGVEQHAATLERIPPLTGKWFAGTIESLVWAEWRPTHALISVQRLHEMAPEVRARVLAHIPQLIVYAYPDTLLHGSLVEQLGHACPDATLGDVQITPHVSVGVLHAETCTYA
jgi:hypothetical protein